MNILNIWNLLLLYNVEFVLPLENFSIEDFKFQNDESNYELISDTKMRNDFYYNLSKVEGMLFRLNKNKEVLDVPMAMSEKSFYEVCNNPKFLYIIFQMRWKQSKNLKEFCQMKLM